MIPSFLTTLLFSLAVVCANRSAKLVGTIAANLSRLCLAAVLLALWAHWFGKGLSGDGLIYFVLSGCVGFGLGDIAAYEALARIGSRLTILLAQCLAAPVAAVAEWLWLGTMLTSAQIASGLLVLVGVAIAVAPKDHINLDRRLLIWGVIFGVLAGCGQGLGAVLSRKAYDVAALAGQDIDGGTAAYQRIIGGLVVVGLFFTFARARARLRPRESGIMADQPWGTKTDTDWRRAWPWILFHTLAGPTVGVSCYQWALATTPSGIVLPIVATTPLVVIPFAYWMEGDRPSIRSIVGGVIAVIGAIALTLVR